jgi:hypothetical protein
MSALLCLPFARKSTHFPHSEDLSCGILSRNESNTTLVGAALERKLKECGAANERSDTTARLDELRALMQKEGLDY